MNIIDFLANKVLLFADFTAEQLQELVDGSTVTTFESGEAVVEFGEKGCFLGVMLEGEAEVAVTDNSGEKNRICLLKPGDIFGEMELMTGEKNIADVVGITHCRTLLIPQNLFSARLIAHPRAIQYLSQTISQRIKNYNFDIQGRQNTARMIQLSSDPYGFQLHSSKPMKLLIINSSSTWIRYKLYNTADKNQDAWGILEGIGSNRIVHNYSSSKGSFTDELPGGDHRKAAAVVLETLTAPQHGTVGTPTEITAVGHRVVHGGDKFTSAVVITAEVLAAIENLAELAPLHNPYNIAVIREMQKLLPAPVVHVAVFDTAFHHTMPPYAYLYGLPAEYREKYKIRRYGFHGMSHRYAALKACERLRLPFNALEIITCHLGSGASMCAIDHGRSVDTTMGFTPAEGLIMSTRCGSIDPALLTYLMRREQLEPDELDRLINKQSGLLGLSGSTGSLRELEQQVTENADNKAILAIKTYAYQVRKQIGAYMAAMGGLDVLVFTGAAGVHSSLVRALACHGLDCLGIHLDTDKNRDHIPADGSGNACIISADHSQVKVVVVQNEEERLIARETLKVLEQEQVTQIIRTQGERPIPLEVSAHHIHLSQAHIEALFGPGYELTVKAPLSQPGQFACNETVTLSGPKGEIERVRVLGPERKETQVEIAMTEQFKLGVQPPIRESGDLEGTPGLTIKGEKGTVTINKGVICALRHIHMSPEEALQYGLRDKDVVRVRVEGDRELIFGDVLIRVRPDFRLAMHIDTDEANAASIRTGMNGFIDSIQSRGDRG